MTRQRRERPTAGAAVFLLFAAALVFGLTLGATSAEASLPRTADAAALNLAAPDAAAPELEAAWAVARDPLDDVALNHALDAAPRLGFASSLELLAPENAPPGFGLFSCPETSRCERTYARNNPLKYVDRDGRQAGLAIDAEHFQLAAGRITLAEHEAHMAASVALNTRLTPYVLAGAALSVVGGLYVGLGGVGAEMMAALTPASASALQTGAGLISGPYGQVARQELLNLSAAGGSTTTLLTRLTSAPEAGRALSTAAGEGATALTNAARAGGTLYQASIPNALLQALEKAGLAVRSTTMMNGVKAVEYRFLPKATEFIVNFFEKAANQ